MLMPVAAQPFTDPATRIDTFQLFKQRILKVLLIFGTTAILTLWLFESHEQRLMIIDRVAYPILAGSFFSYLMIVHIRPETLPIIEVLSFATLTTYMLIYFYAMIYHLVPNITIYDMATFTQWFPLVYTAAFMFLQTRQARIASIVIYVVLLFPTIQQHQHLFNTSPFMTSDLSALLLNMNVAHPVYIAVLAGIAELKENFVRARSDAEKLSIAAHIDYLTGVANRRATVKALHQAIDQVRATGQGLGILLIDIDHFKQINDTFGHDSGDLVLITFAEAIRTILPADIPFGRWGGEEFLVIAMPTARDEVIQCAEQIRCQLETINYTDVGRVTASFGIAIVTADDTVETLVKRADLALYRAKENGRNRVEIE
jgi:diguanylate cyclase (GGDEF)-like protein